MDQSRPFAERLTQSVATHGHALCAGLDPWWDLLPVELTEPCTTLAEKAVACQTFCCEVIDQIAGEIGVVKPQAAYFEQYGSAGVHAFHEVARHAKRRGLLVIGDVKRGDIGSTATAYAKALFRCDNGQTGGLFDAVTVNPFFGTDGVLPFLEEAQKTNGGVFLLLRTSNPSSSELQDLRIDGRPFYSHLAELIQGWVDDLKETTRYSLIGAVVGATQGAVIQELRERLPRCWFLMPGVGAQGAEPDAASAAMDESGEGGLISVSRGLLFPWRVRENVAAPSNWQDHIGASARDWAQQARQVGADR